jgi:chromate transporter
MRTLTELARLFLRLGLTSFGGPAVHIAMMEDEVVARRRWMTREQFLDLVGATNLIPGPNSTEMAIHIGHLQAGWAGWMVAGAAFILPATLIVLGLAWAYVRYGALPETSAVLYAVKPVVIAVVVQALWRLGRTALRTPATWAIAVAASLAAAVGMNEIAVLAGAALVAAAARHPRGAVGMFVPLAMWPAAGSAVTTAAAPGLLAVFLFFAKVGAILFGSGYVLIAFLQTGLVEERGWLTEGQLLDAIAMGQVTPGPLSTTATFVGYLLGGWAGAIVATVGMFLPAFFFVAVSAPLVPRLRRSPVAGAALDGLNAAALALMAVATVRLATAAIVDPVTAILTIVSAVLLLRFGVNSAWIVVGAAAAGLLWSRM